MMTQLLTMTITHKFPSLVSSKTSSAVVAAAGAAMLVVESTQLSVSELGVAGSIILNQERYIDRKIKIQINAKATVFFFKQKRFI